MPVRKIVFVVGYLGLTCSAFGQVPVEVGPAPAGSVEGGLVGVDPAAVVDPILLQPNFDRAMSYDGPPPINPAELPPIPESWQRSAWDPQPRIEARGEAIFMQPDFLQSVPLFTEFQNQDNTVVERAVSAETGSRYIGGGRGVIEAHFGPKWSFEASSFYVGGPIRTTILGQRDATKFISVGEGGFLSNMPAGFPTDADAVDLAWAFELWGVDATMIRHCIPLRGPVNEIAFGIGPRFLMLDEEADVTFVNERDSTSARLTAATENYLVGCQLMARARIQTPWSKLRLVAEQKIGLMANFVDENQTGIEVPAGNVLTTRGYSRTQFAALFESNFYVELLLTNHLTVFGGFQLFYVDRVDRASGQFTTDLNQFISAHEAVGSLFMYGPTTGVVISY